MLLAQAAAPPQVPDWLFAFVAAGTIIAAIITAFNALLVAVINAFAARHLANHTAHRERRKEVTSATVAHGREVATGACTLNSALIDAIAYLRRATEPANEPSARPEGGVDGEPRHAPGSADALARLTTTATDVSNRLRTAPRPQIIPTGDRLFDVAVSEMGRAESILMSYASYLSGREEADEKFLHAAAVNIAVVRTAATALELAAEAYTFQSGRARREARRTLKLATDTIFGMLPLDRRLQFHHFPFS